jgi:hypothetical protein
MDVRLPDGTIITNVPEGTTQSELMRRVGLMAVPSAAPVKEAGFNLGDIAKSFGMGAVGSTKALTDVAGADNVVSSKLGDVSKSIQQSLSPERQAEMERQAARMKAAEESGSFLQEVKAGALNVAEAPLQSAAQAIGSFVPYLPALFAAPAAAAMRLSAGSQAAVRAVAQQAPKVIGTAQGAGAVKGSIYDGVLKAEIEAGADPEVAKKKADAAQSYFGENFDQIALGAGLGYAAGSKGVEELFTKAGRDSAARGVTRRVGETVLKESLPEAAQGGQERVAQNVALQREGYDVGTFTGAAGAATQEALTGALGAAPIAAISGPGAQPAAPTTTPAAAPAAPAAPVAAAPSPTQAIEDQAAELERQQQRQEAAMERARAGGIGGGSEVNQTLLEQARIRKEQQERAAAAEEKAAEDERKKALRAERARIDSTQYSGDPMMNEVMRSRAVSEFNAKQSRADAGATGVTIPKDDNYALLTQAKERLREQDTPEAKKMMARIDERLNSIVLQDVERMSKEAETTKTAEAELKRQQDIDRKKAEGSVFGQDALPEMESRDVIFGNEALADLQAPTLPDQELSREEASALTKEKRATLGKPYKTPEEERLEQAEMDRRKFARSKESKSGTLMDALKGKLSIDAVSDIGGRRGRGYESLVAPKGKTGSSLEDLVDAGELDSFLPPDERVGMSNFDSQNASNKLRDMLSADKQTPIFDVQVARRGQDDAIAALESDVAAVKEPAVVQAEVSGIEPGEAASVERAATDQEIGDATDIRYKRATGKVGIGKQAVQDTVDAVKARWANAPEVVVAENMDDPAIPQEVRDHNKEAVAKGAKGSPQGFYYKGKAYVIADSIGSTNEAVEALMHEALGHFGLRGVFGPKMETVLRDVIKNRRTEVEGKAEQYGLDPKSDKDMLEAAEEVLAVMAQTKPGLPFVKRAIAVIKDFLRNLGFDIKMSDADLIEKYILPARAFVESGKGRPTEGKPAAMRVAEEKLPPVKSGMTRIYRGEYTGPKKGIPDWIKFIQKENGHLDAQGRWWTESFDVAKWYAEDAGEMGGVVYQDVPTDVVEKSRVKGSSVEKFSRAPEEELFLPMEYVGRGKPVAKRKADKTEDVRYSRQNIKGQPTPNQAAQANLDILDATGMQLQPPEPGRIQNIKDTLRKMGEDPALTKDSAKSAVKKFLDKMEVAAFSGDAAFNNDIRRNLEKDFADNPQVLGMLLEASQSQAVHADALATQFIVDGGIFFDTETKKWVSIKKEDNFIKLAKQIEKAAEKYGLNKEQTEQIAHTYFVAKRFKDLLKKQNARDAEIDRLNAELDAENANIKQYKKNGDFEKLRTSERAKNDIKADIEKLEKAKVLISEDQRAMIEPGLSLVKNMPELEDISETWQGIRANAVKAMIDGNLWSLKYAEDMLDNAAYVPFYRDEQLDEGGGPQEFIKGLQVKAEEFRLKGSNAAVNDVFDNMVRWTQYAINRSVRNHKALQMVDLGTDLQVGDRKMAEKVKEMDPKKNTIRVFRDGKQEIYSMADPLYVDAFSAISNVTIPSLKFFTWFSNLLRQSVVLYPLFSVAQVPQDAISAMFTSGLRTRYALRIPVLAVKEFLKTLIKTSSTHNLLKSYGATGVRDFNATVARQDIQIAAGLKGAKGAVGKTVEMLSHIAMAADNSIRQAVYEASMQQGLSKGEAIEKAFDIINFRRRGTSKLVNLAGQTVPFFYAYMSVQRTAYKTLTLVGISPQKRKEALNTLATTSGAVMALSLFYVMMNGGDEEYEKTPTAIRDRTLNVPGTGGFRIPLRPDLFLMPKVLTEHLYHLITDTGFSDGAKFRKSVADGVANAVLSPQPIPQAVKPAIEVAINYDFFQGRPLIGQFEKQKEAERQFNDNTSEFSKLLGEFGVSPIAADHMIRGMFGSAGGLFLYTTNFMINSDPDVPRPELSFRDALSALPGTSGFVTKASENALKTDFYALRDEVEKVKNTYNDIKTRSPQELEQFLSDEKNIARLGLAKGTEKIGMQLSKIRRAINQITNAPEDLYSASEKKDAIKELREVEKEMLKSVDIPALRKMAMM